MQTEFMAVKKEESTPARRLTFPAKAKGPVGRTAHEAALGVPGDESMEDGEHLFSTSGPFTATDCQSHADLPCSSQISLLHSVQKWPHCGPTTMHSYHFQLETPFIRFCHLDPRP